jgi:hypothetical protein
VNWKENAMKKKKTKNTTIGYIISIRRRREDPAVVAAVAAVAAELRREAETRAALLLSLALGRQRAGAHDQATGLPQTRSNSFPALPGAPAFRKCWKETANQTTGVATKNSHSFSADSSVRESEVGALQFASEETSFLAM